jgi:hypothetical protein
VGAIHFNFNTLGWPSYSAADDLLLFNAEEQGTLSIDAIALAADKINGSGSPATVLTNAKNGVWFSNGSRPLTVGTSDADPARLALTVSPNPIADRLNLGFTAAQSGTATLRLFDSSGKRVLQRELPVTTGNNRNTIELPGLPAGLYTVQLILPEGLASRMIVRR